MRVIYLVLITLVALLALLLAAASALHAQYPQPVLLGMPAYGLTLSGTLTAPVIENHSRKTIRAYTIMFLEANGGGPTISGFFSIPPGGKYEVTDPNSSVSVFERVQRGAPNRLVRARLLNVTFAGGEFVGTDERAKCYLKTPYPGGILEYFVDIVAQVLGIGRVQRTCIIPGK
jgi:hypothetical protein